MNMLGNFLWLIFGGLLLSLSWFVLAILWCITIIGIPIGKQCFKFAVLTFSPFRKDIVYGGTAVSLMANILWLILTGVPMAAANVITGLVMCITIIGIPFGTQYFKIAKLSLMPFGAEIIKHYH